MTSHQCNYVNTLPDLNDEDACYYAEHLEFHPTSEEEESLGINDDDLAAVLPYCPNISSALLSGIRDLSSRTLRLLASHADDLVHLDISGCAAVTDDGLKLIASYSTSLRSLKVSRASSITDAGIMAFAGSVHLEELEMDLLPLVTTRSTEKMWLYGKKLQRWSLWGCRKVRDAGFPWVVECEKLKAKAARRGRTTETKEVGRLVLTPRHQLRDLFDLDLSHCARLTDGAILGVVAHAPRIGRLKVAGCTKLGNRAMVAVSELGTYLVELDVAGLKRVTDKGICAIASKCTQLKSVDISFMRRLTDLAVLGLGDLPRLEKLAAAGVPQLTDQAAFFLSEHRAGLKELNLSFCPELTVNGVRALVCGVAGLERLSLSGVTAMSGQEAGGMSRFSERGDDDEVEWEFRGANVRALRAFLEKEEWRKRESERLNIIFRPREDDSWALY